MAACIAALAPSPNPFDVGRAERARSPTPMPHTDPHTLLLNLLRRPEPGYAQPTLNQLDPGEWRGVLEQARRHGVASLLYRQLRAAQLDPPAEILAALQQTTRLTATRNLLLYHQLAKILPRFAQHGLPVIALKGLHLSELVYQDPSLRPMSDMDLLVPVDRLQASYSLLQEMGYLAPPFTNPEKEARRHHHLPPLTKKNAGIIELHWNLAAPNSSHPVDLEALWQRTHTQTLAGIPAQVLSPEDLLLHLALHFNSHNFRLELRHLYDLLATLEHYQEQIDWTVLQTRSQLWRARRCLFLALYLAHELLNAPLPENLLGELQPPGFTAAMAEQARQRLLNPPPADLHPDLVQFWGQQPAANKIKAAWRALFPPLDYMRLRYQLAPGQPPPSPLRIYPYYLLRLGELLRQYSGQVWKLLRRNPQLSAVAQSENNLTNWLRGS